MTTTEQRPAASPRPAPGSRPAEESALARLAGWCHDHRWWVLVAWIVGLVAVNVLAQSSGSNFTNNLTGGTQSAQQILEPPSGIIGQPGTGGRDHHGAVHRPRQPGPDRQAGRRTHAPGSCVSVTSPFDPQGAVQISKDGHIGYVRINFDQSAGNVPNGAVQKVIDTAQSFQAPGFHVALGGEAIDIVAGAKPGPSEGIGILAAVIIMLLAFGSVVAMGLPIITALFGIAVAFAVLDLLSHVVVTPTFAPEIMAMIGLGVGIDYALFVVTRYRQGMAEGRDPRRPWRSRWPRPGGPWYLPAAR